MGDDCIQHTLLRAHTHTQPPCACVMRVRIKNLFYYISIDEYVRLSYCVNKLITMKFLRQLTDMIYFYEFSLIMNEQILR